MSEPTPTLVPPASDAVPAAIDAMPVPADAACAVAAIPPWKRSWFFCAPGEQLTLGWIIGLHVVSVIGLILLPLPSLAVLGCTALLLFLGGLGTTVAYHRALAHRSVSLHPVIEQALIFFAVFNGSGKPQTWVAMHRLHHATSDHDDDISSPHQGGFWWAHLRWLWQADQERSKRLARDLDSTKYRFWGHAQVSVLALSTFGGLLWLWPQSGPLDVLAACLWLGPLRLLWALHVQCTVNSLCHLGPQSADHGSSRNLWWLAVAHMGQGENWHENHHRRQGNPRLGHGWQVDIGWLAIQVLRGLRLAKLRA